MKFDKKLGEKVVWGLVGALTVIAGVAHVFPTDPTVVKIVTLSLGPVTAQMAAGVSAALAGVMVLGKVFGKG